MNVYEPSAQYFKKLLNASPYLQDLSLKFIIRVDASIIHEVLEYISS